MVWDNFYFHRFRRQFFKVLLEQFFYFFRILSGYQSHGYFGGCFRGEYRFSAFSDVTAPDTVYIQGRANASALDGRKSFFAHHFVDVQVFHVFLFIKRRLIHQFALFGAHF